MLNKKYLKILIIILMINVLIFFINYPVSSSENPNSICSNLDNCVLLDDQQLFEIQKGAAGLTPAAFLTPKERAKKISEKLISKANDISINIDNFFATQIDNSTSAAVAIIQNQGKKEYILTITQEDADAKAAKKESPLDLAIEYNNIIQKAINNYRVNIYRNSIRGNPWLTLILILVCLLILIFPELWFPLDWNYFRGLSNFFSILFPLLILLIGITTIVCFFVKPISPILILTVIYFFINLIWSFFNFTRPNFNLNSSDSSVPKNKLIEKKAWEEIQKEYTKGARLPHGEIIEHIYCIDPNYVIYRSKNTIRTYINEDHIDKLRNKSLTRNYNKIQKKLLIVFSNQPEKLEDAKTINTLIARGIRLALDGLQKQAEEVLDVAKKRLDDFNVDYGIFLYLKGSFLTLSRFVLVLLLLKILPILLPNLFNNIFDLLRIPEEFLIVILFGSLGGFLSVAYGIRNRDIRIDLSSNLKRLAASRIYIAVISSLIIYSALKGDIVDGISFLVKDNTCGISIFKTAFISAVAGFVESFVPDLLTRSSEQNKNSDNNSTGL